MKLIELFEVVSDGQEVKLIGDDLGEIVGHAEGLAIALDKSIMSMDVIGVEGEYDGNLKVWVKDDGK